VKIVIESRRNYLQVYAKFSTMTRTQHGAHEHSLNMRTLYGKSHRIPTSSPKLANLINMNNTCAIGSSIK
jgi:hypothetical protein